MSYKNYILLSVTASAFALQSCAAVVTTGVAGTGVTVAQERSVGGAVDDTIIFSAIKGNYLKKDVDNLFVGVSVVVIEGVVMLTGTVKDPDTAIEAVTLAWQVEGVREVINELQVTDKSGITDYAKDLWIAKQIETRLLFGKHIRSINYNIEVVNGVVYVMGLAQSEDEFSRVMNVARTTKHVKQVISHVRQKSDPRRKVNP